MNTIDLKYQIENLYDRAICIDSKSFISHPVRIVQCIKSIIGINPENPSEKLLTFCKDYLNEFSKSNDRKILEYNSLPEVVTFADLELSLKNKDFEESSKNVSYLLKVSDSKHILEFFIEFSLKYNMQSFYCIWSVYKMMLFLKGKDVLKNILFCIELIMKDIKPIYVENLNDDSYDLFKYKYDNDSIEIIWIYYSIINEDLVRKDNILKYIYNNSIKKFDNLEQSFTPNVLDEQKILGRKWILSYVESIDYALLDVKIVLILEACRAGLKASDGVCDDIIWDRLNTYLNEYK